MPYMVANFLRGSGATPSRKSSRSGVSTPYASDAEDDHTVKEMKPKHPLFSLPFSKGTREHGGIFPSSASSTPSVAAIDWKLESPPAVFHGNAEESTGALVSGQIILDIKEEEFAVDSITACLTIHTTHKRPFQSHCRDCQHQYQDIQKWNFLAAPAKLRRGKHMYPFSVLLGGHLPTSIDTPVLSRIYEFTVEAMPTQNPAASSTSLVPIKFCRMLPVKRTVPERETPHHSTRVFPPTKITSQAMFDFVIHPTGQNTVQFKLDGLLTHNERAKTVDIWRLRKLTWKLEETIKTHAPACEKHAPLAQVKEGEKKGIDRSEVRLLGEKSLYEGWKTDYSTQGGSLEFEFDYNINQTKPGSKELKFACDSSAPSDETQVTHQLLLELVMSKEYAPEAKPEMSAQTGSGRIFRMHYGIIMTEHPGLGVSWDNEAPPVYEDVPPSPPEYPQPTQYEDVEPLENIFDELDLTEQEARRASVEPLDLSITRTHE